MKKENLLIVCFDIKDFNKIDKIDLSNYDKVVVASDDFRVHEECKKLDIIDNVTFIQKAIPFTKVADKVINIIDSANLFYEEIERQIGIFKKEYMQLPLYVESGDFTQKIQDLLLYIESLNIICKSSEVTEIIILTDTNKFVSTVIKDYASYKKLKFRILNKRYFNIAKNNLKYKIRPFYYLAKTIYIKLQYILEQKIKNEQNVSLTWLFSKEKKHIDNSVFLDDIMKQSTYNSLLYSWRVGKITDNRIVDKNFKLERIEKYLSWKEIFKSVILNLKTIYCYKKLSKMSEKYDFTYFDINIHSIVRPIIIDYIIIESPNAYRFAQGFESFYNNLDLKLIGGGMNRQKLGMIVESIIPLVKTNKYMFSVFMMGKNIYVKESRRRYPKKYWINTLFFVQNEHDKGIVMDEIQELENNTLIYGSFRGSGVLSQTKEDALKLYDISKSYQTYILFDFASPLFGYGSLEEILSTFYTLVEFIKEYQDICLVVKPHPSADVHVINSAKKNITLNNCIFLKREDNVNYALALSDVVVTKYSTIGIEAMKSNSLVVSYQLDESESFRLYGENGNYVYSLAELKNMLEKVITDDDYKNKLLINQKQFYETNFSKTVDYDIVIENLLKLKNEETRNV